MARFRVKRILRTLPYILAEVDTNFDDEVEDEDAASQLEMEVYSSLKNYMRLMKSYNSNKDMVVSLATKTNRPSLKGSSKDRRTNFSFSLANMIQMTQPKESQLLLQTTSVMKRLSVEKEILDQAASIISDQLIAAR